MSHIVMHLLAWSVLPAVFSSAAVAQAVTSRQLVEVVDIDQPVVSPDGRWVAFRTEQASIERNTYDSTWYVQSLDGVNPPIRVADGGFPLRDSAGLSLPAPAVWSPYGHWIYYRAQVGGRVDVWRAATRGSGAEPVTRDPADVRTFSLSEDGVFLRYSTGATRKEVAQAEKAEYDQGIHVDESVPLGQSLYRSGFIEGRLETQRFGKVWFDRAPLLADEPDRWKAIDLRSGAQANLDLVKAPPKSITASDLSETSGVPWRFSQLTHSGRIAVLQRVGDGEGLREKPDVELALWLNARSGVSATCRADSCTHQPITGVQWRPDSDEVLFTVTEPARSQAQSIFRWNVDTDQVREVVQAAGLVNGGRDPDWPCSPSATVLVCVVADAVHPPRLERFDLETGRRHILFNPNVELERQVAQSSSVRLLRWVDAKGRQFSGQFFPARKTGGKPSPLFVSYYNCAGFLRGAYGDEWPLVPLAENGIAALCINRAPGYALDAVERYDQGLGAIESAIALLASEGEIDRAKVGVGGLSFGSEIALWVATDSDLASAVSVSTPVVSLNYYQFGSMKGDAFFSGLKRFWELGAPDETPERWRIISPTFKLDRISAPVLFQMSEQEYLYSLDYAIPLMKTHRADLYVFPDEPHQKFQPKHKLAVYERNLDWFRFWLQGLEDDAPAKHSQYVQWRLMKEANFPRSSVGTGTQSGR